MKILVTGSNGFVGKNLVANLNNIKLGKDTRFDIKIDEIFCYDIDSSLEDLDKYCKEADLIFHFAGINRPKDNKEFKEGNVNLVKVLLDTLKKYKNTCPIVVSSSLQASLIGRYDNEYGRSKLEGENLFFDYAKETKSKVLVYRFPNIIGKWCKPNYNSAVATFCYNIAHDLPIEVNPDAPELELLFVEDLVNEMINCLLNKETHCNFDGLTPIKDSNGKFCYVSKTYKRTLGDIVNWLEVFKNQPINNRIPNIPNDSFEKKLYSMYLSYLPKEKIKYELNMHKDDRGSFTEVIKTLGSGQVSINISKPGITKGDHWHNTKWEIFVVVKGHALIKERNIVTNELIEFEVSGEKLEAIYMLPGYTHSITNLSKTEDLVTLMWVNEEFDSNNPDTFKEIV